MGPPMRDTERPVFRLLAAIAVIAFSTPALAQQMTEGFSLQGDQPIQIESDQLTVDQQKNTAVFTGNVGVVQGDTSLKTNKMTVYYAKGSDLSSGATKVDRMELEGKVYIKSKDQIATADQGTFNMVSNVMVLTGKQVVLTQGQNVVVGCKLTAHMNTGQAQLDGCAGSAGGGRVQMLLQPGSGGK